MKTDFIDNGIILRTGRFKEADLWVRFLSAERGIVTAFAFGGCRSRKRFCGCLDHLNLVTFHVRGGSGNTYQRLEEGTLVTSPKRLRTDIGRLGLAVNCQKFLEAMGVGRDGAAPAYTLFGQVLEALEEQPEVDPIFPLLFRGRLSFDQGYRPALERCSSCGKVINSAVCKQHDQGIGFSGTASHSLAKHCAIFHVREGTLYCPSCSPPAGPQFRLCEEALDAIRFVQENSPLQWAELCLSSQGRRELTRAVDGFIQFHVGLLWNDGMFRRI